MRAVEFHGIGEIGLDEVADPELRDVTDAKAGTLSIVGVYPPSAEAFPVGQTMNKNLVVRGGNCNHRRHIPELLEMVRLQVRVEVMSQTAGLDGALPEPTSVHVAP